MSASPTANVTGSAAGVLPYATPTTPPPVSDWSPLRNPVFRAMWIASAISYTGFEIRNYAAPLLMVDYRKVFGVSEGMAAYTFTASTLPIPLLVLFAGALADVVDRRKLLIVTHLGMMVIAGLLGILTMMHMMPPGLLLAFLFVIGAGYAMMNPTLLAVLPELVSPGEIRSALALNGLNMNIARVGGPLIGGLIVLAFGTNFYAGKGAAFLATALSLVGVVWVVLRWKPAERKKPAHPETIWGAIGTGFRYTAYSPSVLMILARIFIFISCAGILQTFAGIICKQPANLKALHGDTGAMIWMICFGLGAIAGVYQMQKLQRRFGIEEVVTVCTIVYGIAMLGVARTPTLVLGCFAMALAGFSWVIVPTNFNIATQLAVPAWIKGRAMGMYVLVLWGSMSAGSAVFGRLATAYGSRNALTFAGIGVLLGAIPILWLRLVPKHKEDFTPVKRDLNADDAVVSTLRDGPVAVTVDYRVRAAEVHRYQSLMRHVLFYRRRNGAVHWHLSGGEPEGDAVSFRETFQFPSWVDRVRFHDRTTKFDVALEEQLLPLLAEGSAPVVRHERGQDVADGLMRRGRDACLQGFARELPRALDRLDNARRYGWDGKPRD